MRTENTATPPRTNRYICGPKLKVVERQFERLPGERTVSAPAGAVIAVSGRRGVSG